ncbi:MAG: hypothetical protein HY906_23255 [Deltaproteobacteria bacterium]|nr:hypothetical protein [Deltaproteobacteria bacterium]
MAKNALALGIVMFAGVVIGCGGEDPGPGDLQPPPEAPPAVAPPPAATHFGARVSIDTTGTFAIEQKEVVLWQGDAAAAGATSSACTWLGSADLASGQRHAFECGAVEPSPGSRDLLAPLSLTLENVVEPTAGLAPTHEFTVSAIAIDLVRSSVDGEESIDGQACALQERLGKPAGDQALPNRLRVQFGGDACAVVSRDRYLNTIWLIVGGTPQAEFRKYLYAGQAPGARPFVGGFSDQTYAAFDFVSPAVPTAGALIFVALANKPTQAQYDSWVLSAISVRTGAGMHDLDLDLAIACTGGATDASDVTCSTDGVSLACSSTNQCFR